MHSHRSRTPRATGQRRSRTPYKKNDPERKSSRCFEPSLRGHCRMGGRGWRSNARDRRRGNSSDRRFPIGSGQPSLSSPRVPGIEEFGVLRREDVKWRGHWVWARGTRATPFPPEGSDMATKERLAAMAASLCALCSGAMVLKLVEVDPSNGAVELRTYVCAECGHSGRYGVAAGDS